MTQISARRKPLKPVGAPEMLRPTGDTPAYGSTGRHLLEGEVVRLLVVCVYGCKRVLPENTSGAISVGTAGYCTLRQFALIDRDPIGRSVRRGDFVSSASRRADNFRGRSSYCTCEIQRCLPETSPATLQRISGAFPPGRGGQGRFYPCRRRRTKCVRRMTVQAVAWRFPSTIVFVRTTRS